MGGDTFEGQVYIKDRSFLYYKHAQPTAHLKPRPIKTCSNILPKSQNYLKIQYMRKYEEMSISSYMQKYEETFKIFLFPFNLQVESAPPNFQMVLIELQSSIVLK